MIWSNLALAIVTSNPLKLTPKKSNPSLMTWAFLLLLGLGKSESVLRKRFVICTVWSNSFSECANSTESSAKRTNPTLLFSQNQSS